MIRKATKKDVVSVVKIYDEILKIEASGNGGTGWIKGIYPTERTAYDALCNDTLFVYEDNGKIVAAAKIDHIQVPEYADCNWEYNASDNEVMVLHTLAVDPNSSRRGFGKGFVDFYEQYALKNNCRYLRMDTNEINTAARKMYKKLGYREAGIVSCVFNGIPDVRLVCLEKKL